MESISDEKKNFIIIQLVVTGIAPRAVRKIFDREFHPVRLKSSLDKGYKKIKQLQNRRVLSQTQMDLLYPGVGIEPSSSTFDTSLMLCLLRNLTNIDVYDQSPQPHNASEAADLGRMHYYRNECAHMNICEISTEEFNSIWTDLTQAIQRLGGIGLYTECQTQKQSMENIDQRILCEIFNEMNSSMKENGNIKEEIDRLKKEIDRIKEEKKLEIDLIRVEQQEEAELQFHFISKERFQQNIEIKRKWREQLNSETFILSKAAISIFETIQHNQFVAVSGMCGSGKSTLAQYVALRMSESHAYFVISASSTNSWDFILRDDDRKPDKKILYILDDFFGKFSISDFDHMRFTSNLNSAKYFAARNQNFRFLFTCRPHVFAMSKIKDVLPSIIECNLHSSELSLSFNERRKIFDLYIPDEETVYQDNNFLRSEQLPLLCTLYRKHFCSRIQDFILNSDQIITNQISALRESENPSFIFLALLMVVREINTKYGLSECISYHAILPCLRSVISESNFKNTPMASLKFLLLGLDAIEGIYVKREGYLLSFINDKICDIVISCIGGRFIHSILTFTEYSFIENRVRLESFVTEETVKSASIILNKAYNEIFFARLIQEIRNGNERVFANIQNKNQGYRTAFIEYLKVHLTESDVDSLKSPLLLSCKMGYVDFVLYLVGKWNRLLEYSIYETETPLSEACSMGYFNIVKFLVDSQKNIDLQRTEPIELACKKGHLHIVEFLLTQGVYQDLTQTFRDSCANGYTDIVLLLIKKEPNLLELIRELSGRSNVLNMACTNGHEKVVRILLRHNLPAKNPYSAANTCTPLYYASMKGHLNIVKLLLNTNAQVHERDISVAEWNDHEEVVKCLRNHLSL
ncbi:uncharacterized protein [Mytilus edulis]|uniref:uncharacterized protein n=1 Tax=Mytilus edulis TaxID=6550 RepID=UPI0039EE7D69